MLTGVDRSEREQGFTLVELLVAMTLILIVGGVVVTSVVRALQVTTQANERTTALTDIERGLERVTRQIRVADPLEIDPDGECNDTGFSGEDCEEQVLQRRLDADTYSDGELKTYSYYLADTVDGQELRQDITFRDIETGLVTAETTGDFIADIANDFDTPLFQFLAADPVTGELTELSCESLTVEECRNRYATASAVRMTLSKVLTDSTPLSASTVVNIRNTRYEP